MSGGVKGGGKRRVARTAAAPTLRLMQSIVPSSFLEVIQLAITPVILLSGVGGLMITLTNRMARVVDRTRALAGQVRTAAADASDERVHLESQLEILWRRSRLVQRAVMCAGLSMLLACVLVSMFVTL